MSTRQSWFDHRLSVGNLITIGTVLVAVVFGWAKFDNRLGNVEQEIDRVSAKIEKLESERTDLQTRIIRIEEKISMQNDVLQKILRNTEK